MKPLALLLVVLLSAPALAQEQVKLEPSDNVTFTLSEREMDLVNMRLARLDAENKTLKEEVKKHPSAWVFIVSGVVILGVGFAAGVAVAPLLQKAPAK